MSIEHGFSSPLWLAKAVISQADPRLLKFAVCELLDELWVRDHINHEDIFDRLVQVATVGKYTAPDISQDQIDEAIRLANGILGEDIDREVEEFSKQLDDLPEFNAEEYKKWLRDLGVPEEGEDDNT